MSNITCPDCGGAATLIFVNIYCKEDCSNKKTKEKQSDWYYFVTDTDFHTRFINENISSLLVDKDNIRSYLQNKFDNGIHFIGIGKCWPKKGHRTTYVVTSPSLLEKAFKKLEDARIDYETFDPID